MSRSDSPSKMRAPRKMMVLALITVAPLQPEWRGHSPRRFYLGNQKCWRKKSACAAELQRSPLAQGRIALRALMGGTEQLCVSDGISSEGGIPLPAGVLADRSRRV